MNNDFNLKVTVRNGRLLNAIRERYESVADLARQTRRSPASVNALVTMTVKPTNEKGWTELALDVAAMVGKDPEDLWPEHMREIKLKRATAEMSVDLNGVKQIMADGSSEKSLSQISAIKQFLNKLTPREEQVINLKWGENQSLTECGKILNLTKERVRQIEAKSLRKMRHAAKVLGYGVAQHTLSEQSCDIILKQSGRDLLEDH